MNANLSLGICAGILAAMHSGFLPRSLLAVIPVGLHLGSIVERFLAVAAAAGDDDVLLLHAGRSENLFLAANVTAVLLFTFLVLG